MAVVTQWLTWITEVERHQPLWQQLEHPNEQNHLHLEVTYLAQLTQYHEEATTAEGGGCSDQDTHMTDTDHKSGGIGHRHNGEGWIYHSRPAGSARYQVREDNPSTASPITPTATTQTNCKART